MRRKGAIARMSLRHIEFLLQESFTGIRRNAFMSIAAVSAIAVSLLLLGSLSIVTANLNQLASSLCDRMEMRVFLSVHLPDDQREALNSKITALPAVKQCRLVTRNEAWPELRKHLNGQVTLNDLQGLDWLPDSFMVQVRDLGQMGSIAEQIRAFPGVDEVVDTHETADKLVAITKAIQAGGYLAVGLLLIAAAIIVSNTIRLTVHARRLEISIMQLVGATNGCVRTPFLLEGLFQGLMGSLFALLLLGGGYVYLHRMIRQAVPFLEILPPDYRLFAPQIGILVGIGLCLGLLSSYLAVRKYLRA